MVKKKSYIFSDYELKVLNQRLKGDKTDRTGVFLTRIKPKIKELFEVWCDRKKELKELIQDKKKWIIK